MMDKDMLLAKKQELETLIKSMVTKGQLNQQARKIITEYFNIIDELKKYN